MGSVGHLIGTDWKWRGNTRAYLDDYNTNLHGPVVFRVLASATKGHVYYAALERTDSTGTTVFALVEPYWFYGKGYNRELIVKDQDETMGPVSADCPAKILDLLTEPLNDYAAQWRARCRENLAKRKAKPTPKVGDTIKFSHPLNFGVYGVHDTFRVTSWGRRKRFYAVGENLRMHCRIDRNTLSNVPYEVISRA